jgi:hypothetical protein
VIRRLLRLTPNRTKKNSLDPQNPALDLRSPPFGQCQGRFEEFCKTAIEVSLAHPRGDRIGVVLVGGTVFACKAPAPQGRIDLNYHRPRCRYFPAIEWPEMDPVTHLPADVMKPWQTGMSGPGPANNLHDNIPMPLQTW